MKILSIAICDNKCYIATKQLVIDAVCNDIRHTSERMLELLTQIITDKFDTLIFSSGPESFTTMRVIGSVVKGIKLCYPNIEIIAISTFLSLFSIISLNQQNGSIAINTRRGDFYCMDFHELRLYNKRIINSNFKRNTVFIDAELTRNKINLAEQQIKLLNTEKFIQNQQLIQHFTNIDYGTNPIYTF